MDGSGKQEAITSEPMLPGKELHSETSAGGSSDSKSDENQERGNWTNQLDFLLSCVGFAVGLSNIWRFPYLCMRNGGGAFLIPYFLFLFIVGIPLFFMELTIGQFSGLSPVTLWRMCPLFKGAGWGSVVVSGVTCVYYNVIIAWILYYLFCSFTLSLPWGSCGNPWNTPACITRGLPDPALSNMTNCQMSNFSNLALCTNTTGNGTNNAVSYETKLQNWTRLVLNSTQADNGTVKPVSSAEEYFHNSVLEMSSGIEQLDGVRWQLLLCLMLSWIILFAAVSKGIKSSGKVVYVTAVFPYILLIILFIRGLLLPGAFDGIKFYIVPKWSRLLSFNVWQEAALQIFYSLGPAWGGMITFASYNKFHNNIYRDAMLIPLINCGTSFFGGFVIFSVVGYMAQLADTTVDKIVTQGPGLAFIVYPEALTRLPISPLWAILFFLMLLTVGLDSQMAMFECMTSGFADEYSFIRRNKTWFSLILCVAEMLLGILIVTRAGMYWFQIIDWYAAYFSLMLIALVEAVVIAWVYGARRIYDELEMMIGYKPVIWWSIAWRFIVPVVLVFMLVSSLVRLKPPTYGSYNYPGWAQVFGWCVAFLSVIPIPIVFSQELFFVQRGPLLQRLKNALRPTEDWGPSYEGYKKAYHDKYYTENTPNQENAELLQVRPLDEKLKSSTLSENSSKQASPSCGI